LFFNEVSGFIFNLMTFSFMSPILVCVTKELVTHIELYKSEVNRVIANGLG